MKDANCSFDKHTSFLKLCYDKLIKCNTMVAKIQMIYGAVNINDVTLKLTEILI